MTTQFTRRTIWLFAVLGFFMPFLWFAIMMGMFSAPESLSVSVIRWTAVISCPPLFLQPYLNLDAWLLAPFLNAILYYLLARSAGTILARKFA